MNSEEDERHEHVLNSLHIVVSESDATEELPMGIFDLRTEEHHDCSCRDVTDGPCPCLEMCFQIPELEKQLEATQKREVADGDGLVREVVTADDIAQVS